MDEDHDPTNDSPEMMMGRPFLMYRPRFIGPQSDATSSEQSIYLPPAPFLPAPLPPSPPNLSTPTHREIRRREREHPRNPMDDFDYETMGESERYISLRRQIRSHTERARQLLMAVPPPSQQRGTDRVGAAHMTLEEVDGFVRSRPIGIYDPNVDFDRERQILRRIESTSGVAYPISYPDGRAPRISPATMSFHPNQLGCPIPPESFIGRNHDDFNQHLSDDPIRINRTSTFSITFGEQQVPSPPSAQSSIACSSSSPLPHPTRSHRLDLLEQEWDRQLSSGEVDRDGNHLALKPFGFVHRGVRLVEGLEMQITTCKPKNKHPTCLR